jgi:hypothetical protein
MITGLVAAPIVAAVIIIAVLGLATIAHAISTIKDDSSTEGP